MILYNGATGGLGRYLAGRLAARREEGVALSARLEDREALRLELEHVAPAHRVTLIQLAARVSVPACEADPASAFKTNVDDVAETVKEVIDWAGRHLIDLRVLYVSTGHVYATGAIGSRLDEEAPTAPRSVYARTKRAAEVVLSDLCAARGISLLIPRIFGLVAPVQPVHYLLPALVERVRTGDVSEIPGLDHVRDYLDARDACEVLLALAATNVDSRTTLNVCTGESTSIRDMLALVAHALRSGAAADRLLARATSGPGRADDVPWIVGDPSRLVGILGRPARQIALSRTVLEASRHRGVEAGAP